ncbi:MAG: MFS transporter, partial [Dehalococcoidales bacterium]|nr:MFS transporter [Dehalococcoidales bacterium]
DVKGTRHGQLDFLGVGMLLGFASAIVISVTLMDRAYHLPWILTALMGLLGIIFLVMLLRRSKKRPDAVFSREMLVSRPFLAANIFNLAYGATGESGIMTLLPLYAVSVYGMSTLQSGLVSTPRSFGIFAMSLIASFYVMKWGYHRPIIIGTLITAVGLVLLALEPGRLMLTGTGLPPMALVMGIALVAGIGAGLVAPASNNSCIDLMPEQAASITGLRQICRRIGQTISIAICTLVLEFSPNMARGFTVLLSAFTALTLLSIIAVFWMPASPIATCRPSRRVVPARETSR